MTASINPHSAIAIDNRHSAIAIAIAIDNRHSAIAIAIAIDNRQSQSTIRNRSNQQSSLAIQQ
jgi:hypothetical protein